MKTSIRRALTRVSKDYGMASSVRLRAKDNWLDDRKLWQAFHDIARFNEQELCRKRAMRAFRSFVNILGELNGFPNEAHSCIESYGVTLDLLEEQGFHEVTEVAKWFENRRKTRTGIRSS
ncbi:MAG: hypothetical protein AB8B55_09360 [Mariniblastus sp.]